MKMKIRKGDRVRVMRGDEADKNKVGEVIRVLPKENRVVVQGVNLVKNIKNNSKPAVARPSPVAFVSSKRPSMHLMSWLWIASQNAPAAV